MYWIILKIAKYIVTYELYPGSDSTQLDTWCRRGIDPQNRNIPSPASKVFNIHIQWERWNATWRLLNGHHLSKLITKYLLIKTKVLQHIYVLSYCNMLQCWFNMSSLISAKNVQYN